MTRSQRSEARLQMRLDEATANKRLNEGVENADRERLERKYPRRSGVGAKSTTSASATSKSSSNVSPGARPHRRRDDKAEMGVVASLPGAYEPALEVQKSQRRRNCAQDTRNDSEKHARRVEDNIGQGQYVLRCHRRETHGVDDWTVCQVKQYKYWASKRSSS